MKRMRIDSSVRAAYFFQNTRLLECRHFVIQAACGLKNPHRERGAGPLSQPHIQIEQWTRPEKIEHPPVPGLRRAM